MCFIQKNLAELNIDLIASESPKDREVQNSQNAEKI